LAPNRLRDCAGSFGFTLLSLRPLFIGKGRVWIIILVVGSVSQVTSNERKANQLLQKAIIARSDAINVMKCDDQCVIVHRTIRTSLIQIAVEQWKKVAFFEHVL
jgi:hypothetical protein